MKRAMGTLACLAAVTLMGCGGGKPADSGKDIQKTSSPGSSAATGPAAPKQPTLPKPAAKTERWPADKAVALLSGKVTLKGKPPRRQKIDSSADPNCAAMHKDSPLQAETAVVGDGGEVANCVVYIGEGVEKYEFEPAGEPVVLSQKNCVYVPHVFTLMVGQPLKILNSDQTSHNVHEGKHRFNVAQAKQGDERTTTFEDLEVGGAINCDIHPWMNCRFCVFEHPFHAVSDEKGLFKFKDKLLPGKYKLIAWHEKFGEQELLIEVKDGQENVEVTFTYDRP